MANYIKTLKEDNNDTTYPVTKSSAVILESGTDLETKLTEYVTAEDLAVTSTQTPLVGTNMIADGAVTGDKLSNSSVGANNIIEDSIDQSHFNLDAMPAGNREFWSSSERTGTTGTEIGTATITTTKNVRIEIVYIGVLKTSRYTSAIHIYLDGTEIANAGTNSTSFITVIGSVLANLTPGSHVLSYRIAGQDSGTTATIAAYASSNRMLWWTV